MAIISVKKGFLFLHVVWHSLKKLHGAASQQAHQCGSITFLAGKESELVQDVEPYQLDIVGLKSLPCIGSGTRLLESGWSFLELPKVRVARQLWGYSQVLG